jgi:O-succinylbenzoate synthase
MTQLGSLRRYRLRLGDRSIVLVEGPCGWGECSPLPGYPCSPTAARAAAIEAAACPWPAPRRDLVSMNALVAGPCFDPDALAGFGSVKVKVGRSREADLAVVSAVRDAVGPKVALRVDANGVWDEEAAEWMLRRLARYGLELAEQPVRSLEAMSRLRRRVRVPLLADECVRSVDDARRLRRLEAADGVVVKVQPLGGVRACLRVAEEAGVPAVVTSMMETSVGTAVALNLAASLPELPWACGLATVGALGGDVTRAPLVAEAGRLRVRRVAPDPDLLPGQEP